MVKKIVFVKNDETIYETARKMYENHVGAAVVLENDSLSGIVTSRDIAIALTIFEKSPKLEVQNIMSTPVLHVPLEESIIKVAEIMASKNIHRLAVLDRGEITGIISTSDLAVLFSMSKIGDKKIFGAYLS